MDEQRLREILAHEIHVEPEDITDDTSNMTVKWDSLIVMNLVFAVEARTDLLLEDDTIATLTSWLALKAAVLQNGSDVIQNVVPFRKVLVLDADGTLWEGIAGEGGARTSAITLERQADVLRLKERGVLLAVASKNDTGTVAGVLSMPEMHLNADDFVAIEEGWDDKSTMLRRIAQRLNVGLDSMVFLDDSPFEREAVSSQLPMVDVPPPDMKLDTLFPTMVDTSKTAQYHALAAAEKTRPQFETEEDFLASLGMKVVVRLNERSEAPRIAELTQKVNQFNLTTRRYTETEILGLMHTWTVYSLHFSDRFGDQGLVGVLILKAKLVDTFLLSCRVLGRGVEFAPWEGMTRLTARYSPTDKNEQVCDFWDRLGLTFTGETHGVRHYNGDPRTRCPYYIEVIRE